MTTELVVLNLIAFWAGYYGVGIDYATEICRMESNFTPDAIGDDGAAVGLYQWHDTSMMYVLRKMKEGGEIQYIPPKDTRYEVQMNIRAAMYAIGVLGLDRWWSTSEEARDNVRKQKRGRDDTGCYHRKR